MSIVVFEDVALAPTADPAHEWTLTTADVASGFGTTPANIRMAKQRMLEAGELVQGRHFLEGGVTDRDAPLPTLWTKRGVIRLGFHLRSERARRFRDFAEDLVLAAAAAPEPRFAIPETLADALQLAADLARDRDQLAATNAELAPKAALAVDLIEAEGTHDIAAAAQILSSIPGVTIGATKLREYLRTIGWITKDRTAPRAMQAQIITGRLVMKEDQWTDADGIVHLRHQIRVTGKGLAELHRLLATSPQLTLVLGGGA